MKSPLTDAKILTLESVESTQTYAAMLLAEGNDVIGAVHAEAQTGGQGRLGKTWFSERGESLTVSFIFREYANHPKPWLIGMGVGLAAAGAVHARLAWPNDLRLGGFKVGGILTNLYPDKDGNRIPVVGVGINLHVAKFPPELDGIAGNVDAPSQKQHEPVDVLNAIIERIAIMPEPESFGALSQIWQHFDETPGKRYRLPDGTEAVGIAVGAEGELICAIEGETTTIMAAEAILGPTADATK
jgi:BirA family biotin operon repressor/biotin-[acetyl-CoA-carboxylase] ligase